MASISRESAFSSNKWTSVPLLGTKRKTFCHEKDSFRIEVITEDDFSESAAKQLGDLQINLAAAGAAQRPRMYQPDSNTDYPIRPTSAHGPRPSSGTSGGPMSVHDNVQVEHPLPASSQLMCTDGP